ncbi:unnamed protein product [Nezara viridula]|uniref:Uncharacterized protein n=1 Tax=Nezara viridula TaxID=85310 RepID=A0A9P0GX69_NEZVI|nr:unnamed protein product [Nezara viridula]
MGETQKAVPTRHDYKNSDWNFYYSQIKLQLQSAPNLRTEDGIDTYIASLCNTLLDAANIAIPKFVPFPPSLRVAPRHVLQLISLRNTRKRKMVPHEGSKEKNGNWEPNIIKLHQDDRLLNPKEQAVMLVQYYNEEIKKRT